LAVGAGPPSLFYPHLPDALGLGVCYHQIRLLWLGFDSGRDSWSGSSPSLSKTHPPWVPPFRSFYCCL
jgi:hypothetical protein